MVGTRCHRPFWRNVILVLKYSSESVFNPQHTIDMVFCTSLSTIFSVLVLSLLLLLQCQFVTSSLYLGYQTFPQLLNSTDQFSWRMAPGKYMICMTADWNRPENKQYKAKVYAIMQYVSLQFLVVTQKVWFLVLWNRSKNEHCDILLIPQRELNEIEEHQLKSFEDIFGVVGNGSATFPVQYLGLGQGSIKLRPTAFETGTTELLYLTLQHELGHVYGLRHPHGWELNRFGYEEDSIYRFGKFDPCTIMGYDLIQGCLKLTKIDGELLKNLYKDDCKLKVMTRDGNSTLLPQVLVSRDGLRLSNKTCVNDGT